MQKDISFGKIAYNGNRRINEVVVSIEKRGSTLSICGEIWNGNHTDIVAGGQLYDIIKEYRNQLKYPKLFDELYFYWIKYHLRKIPKNIIKRIDKIMGDDFEEDSDSHRIIIISTFEIE